MTQNEIQRSLNELIQLVENGKSLEAFDKFYHADFIGQENQTQERVGKATNRVFEENFMNSVTALRTYKAVSTTVGSNVSAITWEIDLDHKEWGPLKMTEINLQVWKDGKIIRETYNYHP